MDPRDPSQDMRELWRSAQEEGPGHRIIKKVVHSPTRSEGHNLEKSVLGWGGVKRLKVTVEGKGQEEEGPLEDFIELARGGCMPRKSKRGLEPKESKPRSVVIQPKKDKEELPSKFCCASCHQKSYAN